MPRCNAGHFSLHGMQIKIEKKRHWGNEEEVSTFHSHRQPQDPCAQEEKDVHSPSFFTWFVINTEDSCPETGEIQVSMRIQLLIQEECAKTRNVVWNLTSFL